MSGVHRLVTSPTPSPRSKYTLDIWEKYFGHPIEWHFARDLEAVRTFARRAENFSPEARRLRPLAVAETLERTALIELDLRLEAAAISEMAQNLEGETGFGIPRIEWDHCARNVLTTNWIDGIPIADRAALDTAGIDRRKLAVDLMRAFLRQAIEHGYFHADMHPGNLFVDPGSGSDPPGCDGACAWSAMADSVAHPSGHGWRPSGGLEDLTRPQQ